MVEPENANQVHTEKFSSYLAKLFNLSDTIYKCEDNMKGLKGLNFSGPLMTGFQTMGATEIFIHRPTV